MTSNRYRALAFIVILLGCVVQQASPTLAQDLPTAREQRQTLEAAGFPTAADLGTGWLLLQAFSYEPDDVTPFIFHEAAYADRYGTRLYMTAGIYDRQSEPDALAFTEFLIARDQETLITSDDAPSARELRNLEDPTGCDEVSRATGEDPLMYFYVGSLTCQDVANDRALWVMLSGVYEGDNFQDGAESILEIVLETTPR